MSKIQVYELDRLRAANVQLTLELQRLVDALEHHLTIAKAILKKTKQ